MGSFFGTIYLQLSDRDKARAAIEATARAKGCRFYMAPPHDGWIAAYPNGSGQDESISRYLATKTSAIVLHVIVHDDDVFCYYLRREGKQLEKFNSWPHYFDEAEGEAARPKRRAVKPKHIYDLLPNPADRPKLEAIFARDPHEGLPLASDSLAQFAALLRLPHECTSYEYLKQGETEAIEDFESFEHFPDITLEEAAAAERKAKQAAALDQFRAAGLLLQHEQRALTKPLDRIEIHVARESGGGFLATWQYGGSRFEAELWRYRTPWEKPERLNFPLRDRWSFAAGSPSGRLVALYRPQGQAIVYSDTLEPVPGADRIDLEASIFLPNDDGFVARVGNELVVVYFDQPAVRKVIPLPGEHGHGRFVHPRGEHIIVERDEQLWIIRISDGVCVRRFAVSRGPYSQDNIPNDFLICHWALVAQLDRMDWDGIEAIISDKSSSYWQGHHTPSYARNIIEQIRQYRAYWRSGGWLYEYITRCSPEAVYDIKWDTSGDRMFCATSRGVRGYEWRELIAGDDERPHALLEVDAIPFVCEEGPGRWLNIQEGLTYTLEYDGVHERVIYGGLNGMLMSVDLKTKYPRSIVELPGRPAIHSLLLHPQQQVLCMELWPELGPGEGLVSPHYLQIWNVAPPAWNDPI